MLVITSSDPDIFCIELGLCTILLGGTLGSGVRDAMDREKLGAQQIQAIIERAEQEDVDYILGGSGLSNFVRDDNGELVYVESRELLALEEQ